jgi:hypothetical protein
MPDPHVTTRFAPDGGLALANFVRSSSLTQAFPLTTGTFNLIVKDRFAFPPERRVFSPPGSRNESSRPRNLLKISFCLRPSQLADCTGFPHEIQHSAKASFVLGRASCANSALLTTNNERPTTAFSTQQNASSFPLPAPDFIEKKRRKNSQSARAGRKMIG